jgi:hypothetical protein
MGRKRTTARHGAGDGDSASARSRLGVCAGGNNQFRRIEVVGGNMLPGGLQEIVSGIKPGQQVVSNALVLQSTVEQ